MCGCCCCCCSGGCFALALFAAIRKGFKGKSLDLMVYARVLRKLFGFDGIRKGFKEKSLDLMVYARVLRKLFGSNLSSDLQYNL